MQFLQRDDLVIEGHVTQETSKQKHLELGLRCKNPSVDINHSNGGDSDFKITVEEWAQLVDREEHPNALNDGEKLVF